MTNFFPLNFITPKGRLAYFIFQAFSHKDSWNGSNKIKWYLKSFFFSFLALYIYIHTHTHIYMSIYISLVQSLSRPTLCDPTDCRMPGLPVHHQFPELTQTHVHHVSDAIQTSHPMLSPFPYTFNLSQHQGLCKWVSSSHQVAKILEIQLQHQSFQWIFRTDFL